MLSGEEVILEEAVTNRNKYSDHTNGVKQLIKIRGLDVKFKPSVLHLQLIYRKLLK